MEMAREKKAGKVGANTDPVLLQAKADACARYYPVGAARLHSLPEDLAVVDHGAIADMLSSNNDDSSPYAVVPIDAAVGAKAGNPVPLAPGHMAGGRGGGNLSAVVGIVAASTAVTALAGGTVNPAVAFGSFLVLLGGVALAKASVRTTT